MPVGRRMRFFFQCTVIWYASFRWLVKVILSNFIQLSLTSSMFICSLFSVTLTYLLGGCFSDGDGTWLLLPKHDRKCWFSSLLDKTDLWQWSHLLFLTSSHGLKNQPCCVPFSSLIIYSPYVSSTKSTSTFELFLFDLYSFNLTQ